MENCTSAFMDKVSETVNCLLESCMPPKERQQEAESDVRSSGSNHSDIKEELKQLVGIFTSKAQSFIPSIRIHLETDSFKKARYRLDPELSTFIVQTEGDMIVIPLAQVKAVYGYNDIAKFGSSKDLMNAGIIKTIDEEQKDRLIVIEYTKDGSDAEIILLEQEIQSSDALVTVLRILSIHASGNG